MKQNTRECFVNVCLLREVMCPLQEAQGGLFGVLFFVTSPKEFIVYFLAEEYFGVSFFKVYIFLGKIFLGTVLFFFFCCDFPMKLSALSKQKKMPPTKMLFETKEMIPTGRCFFFSLLEAHGDHICTEGRFGL